MSEIAATLWALHESENLNVPAFRALIRMRFQENDARPEETVRATWELLREDPDLMAIVWNAVGYEALTALLRSTQSRGAPAPSKQSLPATRPSWRAGLQEAPGVVWDLTLPVGSTGRTKRLGDFDAADVAAVESFYKGQVDVMTSRAEYWARIRRTMGPEDTLQQMALDGRLQEHQVGFIGSRGVRDLATVELMLGFSHGD